MSEPRNPSSEAGLREAARQFLFPKIVDDTLLANWMLKDIERLTKLLTEIQAGALAKEARDAGAPKHIGWIGGHCSNPMNCPVCLAEWAARDAAKEG